MAEVDREFRLQHPEAPQHLDPADPHQAALVTAWQQMFTEFLNRTVDSHYYRFFPDSPRLDPNNPGDAQLIEYWTDIRDTIGYGATPKYNWDEHQIGQQPPGADPATAAAGPAAPSEPKPDVSGVQMTEDQFTEYIHAGLEGTHYIADSAEVIGTWAQVAGASEESLVVVLGEALGPIGMVAGTIVIFWAVIRAFGTGTRLQEQEGFCYGVMWQVTGHADEQKGFIEWAGDSADELREAFYAGVADGREKAQETAVHNRIVLAQTYYQRHGDDPETANDRVLNDLWHQARESDLGRDYLTWPAPQSMGE